MRRFAKLVLSVFAGLFVTITVLAYGWPINALTDAPKADAIVCLGAGYKKDLSIGRFSKERAQTCADLFLAGKAPYIIFSGAGEEVTVAEQMADEARNSGLPENALVIEGTSESTIQNALFSKGFLSEGDSILLVTSSSHLTRSWVSFLWAGYDDITLIPSRARDGERRAYPGLKALTRETLATGLNLIRVPLWTLANRFGVENTAWLM